MQGGEAKVSALKQELASLDKQKSELAGRLGTANGYLDIGQLLLERSWDKSQVVDQH